jgi:GT2 family glycosyltransferase
MDVSALICTYNRADLLQGALQALLERTQEKPDQVVIVNGGDQAADELVQDFGRSAGVEVTLVNTPNKNLATSRNVGLPRCGGDIIAMTDDDAEVFPDWVTQIKRVHREHPEAGAVGGPVLPKDQASFLARAGGLATFPSWPVPRYVRTLPGVNIAYKREAVDQVGLQDETLFRGEDVDFNWRVKRAGYEIYFDPSVKVRHHHRKTLRGLIQQQYMYGRAYVLVRRKWPEMYCVYPHGLRSTTDILKAANFLGALVYQPFLAAAALKPVHEKMMAWPILSALGLAWKAGMVAQMLHGGRIANRHLAS